MDEDRVRQISELLHEAAETHHRVYTITDGDDPDWATWYADWLVNLSRLPSVLGLKPIRSELTYLLVSLDKTFTQGSGSGPWEEFYAARLLEHFATRRA
jgi:hypothetical protein